MSGISGAKYNIDVVIDSKYRNDYTTTNSNNFTIDIDSKVQGRILRYGLKSTAIPNTILSSGTFEIEDSTGIKTVTIDPANYNVDTMRLELETKLNALGVDTYTVVILNSKYVFTSNYNDFTINPNNLSSNILEKIGFGITGIYTATLGVLSSYSSINLSLPSYIFVDIAQFVKHIKNTRGVFHNFIIPTCSYGTIISFKPESSFIQQFTPYESIFPSNVNRFTFSLRYDDDTLVDLQNSDWSIVLTLEVVSNYVP